ncbi:hypothetical protein KM043_005322 [Ampulex compressa]|nr:hypothetical protein KM043_005322 [Ampulex compressa]
MSLRLRIDDADPQEGPSGKKSRVFPPNFLRLLANAGWMNVTGVYPREAPKRRAGPAGLRTFGSPGTISKTPSRPARNPAFLLEARRWIGPIRAATYDIHILGRVCLRRAGGGRRKSRRREEQRREEGGLRWWWLAERRRQWCRPVARWRQPWYSNPIAKGVAASAAAAGDAAGAATSAGAESGKEWR